MLYNTEVIKIRKSTKNIARKIAPLADLLKNGEVVAIPTETVYGLGADALNPKAVKKIYRAKGRPSDNPLIVHISNYDQLARLAKEIPDNAKKLMDRFWPGPLTIILKKKKIVPKITTGSRDTVGIRMPEHRIARELIEQAGPIAAPSANSFGRPSPTRASHVLEDLHGKIPAIIDGGSCKIGIESTIIDFTQSKPMILRPGGITLEQIKEIIGDVLLHTSVDNPKKKITDALAPGMKYRHYSPNAKVILVEKDLRAAIRKYPDAAIISLNQKFIAKQTDRIMYARSIEVLAKTIFQFFRKMDKLGVNEIIVDKIPPSGLGVGVINRVKKAASEIM